MHIDQILNWGMAILLLGLLAWWMPTLVRLARNAKVSEEQNTLIELQIRKASQHQEREAEILAAQEELQRRHVRLIEHWDQLTERVQSLVDRLDSKGRS